MIDEINDFDTFMFRSVATPEACRLPCIAMRLTLAYAGARPNALNAGEAYRGLLKDQLESDPDVLRELLDEGQAGRNWTTPGWSLRVEDGEKTASGAKIQRLFITLFGDASRHVPVVLQSIAAGLLVKGVGDQRLAADFHACEVYGVGRGWLPIRIPRLDETDEVMRWRQPMEVLGLMPEIQSPTRDLEIRLHGRLNFKGEGKKVIEDAPPFEVLIKHAIDRVVHVAERWGSIALMPDSEIKQYLALASRINIQQWVSAKAPTGRVSQSDGGKYPRGRLSGILHYRAETPNDWLPLLPWLHAGRAIQLGQQTTMGAGGYDLVFLVHEDENSKRDANIADQSPSDTNRKLADTTATVEGSREKRS